MSLARTVFWFTTAGLLLVVPWLFGGMSEFAYHWIITSGWVCAGCLAIWLWNCGKLHPRPDTGFWVAVVCWSLLGIQVWISIGNPSHSLLAPWTTKYLTYEAVEHNGWLPSSAFWGGTEYTGRLYLGIGLIALASYALGMERHRFRQLMGLFVLNATVLAMIGIPFKFSGERLILGKWEFSEWYFYSTFYYHNHWAAFVLLALGAAGSLFVAKSGAVSRALLLAAMAVMGISVVVAKTRLGVLTVLVFAILFAWFLAKNRILKSAGQVWGWLAAAAVLLVAGTVGASNWSKEQGASSDGRQWESLMQQNPFTARYLLLLDTLPMVAKKPVFGWGLGAYGAAFQEFQRPETITLHNDIPTRYSHPHNDWLEWLAEFGAVGCLLLWAPSIFWLLKGKPISRFAGSAGPLMISWGILILFAFGDMAFRNAAVLVGFLSLVGLRLSSSNDPTGPIEQKKGLQRNRPKGRHVSEK